VTSNGPAPHERLEPERLIDLFRTMATIREFEDQIYRNLLAGLVPGTTHLCQGQEAVPTGAVAALRGDDYLAYTYRGHGVCLARGMAPEAAFAEIYGRATGVSGGLGGSMHLTDPGLGLMGSFGIVGAGLPFAVGLGLAAKLRGKGQVSMVFFGDGACNIGAFHEALNMASVWRLPTVFVCENNLYGEYSRIDRTTPFEDLARRADAYAMPGRIVDGNDVLAVYDAATEAVAQARAGDGPTFLECKTYRRGGHSRTDPATYRPEAEVKAWLARDPLKLCRETLATRRVLGQAEAERIVDGARAEIRAASERAAAAPYPNPDAAALVAATYA
jgi:pyruvate dehydrogenase E1 component alpha subunit